MESRLLNICLLLEFSSKVKDPVCKIVCHSNTRQSVPEEMLDQNLSQSWFFSVEPLQNLFQESLLCSPSNTFPTIRCFSQKIWTIWENF